MLVGRQSSVAETVNGSAMDLTFLKCKELLQGFTGPIDRPAREHVTLLDNPATAVSPFPPLKKGFIVANANCSITGFVILLAARTIFQSNRVVYGPPPYKLSPAWIPSDLIRETVLDRYPVSHLRPYSHVDGHYLAVSQRKIPPPIESQRIHS